MVLPMPVFLRARSRGCLKIASSTFSFGGALFLVLALLRSVLDLLSRLGMAGVSNALGAEAKSYSPSNFSFLFLTTTQGER